MRLDRQVAIKVLPEAATIDEAGRERFEAEARAISRLTHPRISTLYDVGSTSVGGVSVQYLVMELVEGETLAARLKRGPLAVDQALAVAVDIADALAAAHAAGVIHRDIKPANVMLTRSGAKLLDFGLARLRRSPGAGQASNADGGARTSETGLFGTLPYMAPEVLRGVGADARTDLFAFGAVLYEMLAGRPAFAAESEADLVARLLEHEPAPISTRQPLTPAPLARLIATCLAKDPDERWQTSQDLVRALRWVRDDQPRAVSSVPAPRAMSWRTVAWVAAAALAGALVATAVKQGPLTNVSRVAFPVFAPPGTQFPRGTAEMAVAPDGSGLVFVAIAAEGARQLWLRRFDAVHSVRLAGTEGANDPFWSPDSRWVAFFAGGKLLKVPRTGGQPQVLCDARTAARGTWNQSGTILFGDFGESVVQRVPDSGGSPQPATVLDQSRGERAHLAPVFLPDGRRFVYLAIRADGRPELVQGSLDSVDTHRMFESEANVGVAGPYLISLNRGVLVAQPYDPERPTEAGPPVKIADQVLSDPPRRSGVPFSAGSRVIAYRSASPNSRLLWFDRTGRNLASFPSDADYHHPRLSPDEKSLLIEKTDPAIGFHTIWFLDLLRGTASRLVADPVGAHQPVWSPDGRRLAFASNRLGGLAVFMAPADGSAGAEAVLPGETAPVFVADWSRDGRYLLNQVNRVGNPDLEILRLADRARRTFAGSAASEIQGQFSPDGSWIAYTSDESGSSEVYVRHFAGTGAKWQISTHGGAQGRWRGDGRELFYLALDGRLMAVDIRASGASFEAGAPRTLFNTGITGSFVDRTNQYLVTLDGQRVLVNRSAEDENSAPITIVMNWDAAPPP